MEDDMIGTSYERGEIRIWVEDLEHTFDMRDDKIVVCVKCPGYHNFHKHLSAEHQALLDRIKDESEEEYWLLEERAAGRVGDDWWEWARGLASDMSLGEIYSTGRNGGWLVLASYTWSWLDDRFSHSGAEIFCVRCGKIEQEHLDERVCDAYDLMGDTCGLCGQGGDLHALIPREDMDYLVCPRPRVYTPERQHIEDAKEDLRNLIEFEERILRSLEGVPEQVADEMAVILEERENACR